MKVETANTYSVITNPISSITIHDKSSAIPRKPPVTLSPF